MKIYLVHRQQIYNPPVVYKPTLRWTVRKYYDEQKLHSMKYLAVYLVENKRKKQ